MLVQTLRRLLLLLHLFAAGIAGPLSSRAAPPRRDFYQLRIYHLQTAEHAQRLNTYLRQAYLPALHRAGISKVGVFRPAEKADAGAPAGPAEQLVFVFVPCRSAEQYLTLEPALEKDKAYQTDAQQYLGAAFDNPMYARMETVLLRAFTGLPAFQVPALQGALSERVYELRSYEGATEKLHENKVAQFNNGEISIFKRLNFNTVFCGQVVAGSKMPNLMYLSSFENQADRDAHWRAFGADAEWKKLSAQPEYAHNMLRMDVYLLHPAAYSEI